MTMTHSHLPDDRLVEVCLDRQPEPLERQHLEVCGECEQRRMQLARLLADVAGVAQAGADAAFPPERLARQRARILERIEREGRAGRVIAFPAGNGPDVSAPRARPGVRWIAGAAAAGLLIGLVAGSLVDELTRAQGPASQTVAIRGAAETGPLRAVSTTLSEEEFLGQLELAIEGSGSMALRPLDDMTPLVWEVTAR
jgi:hypothetical protein